MLYVIITIVKCIVVSLNWCIRIVFPYSSGLYINSHDTTKLASMAKLKAGRLVRELSDSCLQYWGGMGYTYEAEVSRLACHIFSPDMAICLHKHYLSIFLMQCRGQHSNNT